MQGLSYREYLKLFHQIHIRPYTLEEILESSDGICNEVNSQCRPLAHFEDYLKHGYYPFYLEGNAEYYTRIENITNLILEIELPQQCGVDISNVRKLKSLLGILSSEVPFMVDITKLSALAELSRTTILAYLPSGNPLTLESIAYGFAAAAMLAAVVLWFSCWNTVMTSDKLMHLFGRVVPALSLLLSMTLRFVPRFQAKLREVTAARRGMGLYAEKGRLQKLKSAVTVFSVMVTWSLENAVETADSMKSRGYGLPGRTAFSLYRYSRRDRLLLLWLTLCGTYIAAGWALGGVKWRYYPTARGVLTPYSASVLLAYFLLCLTPVLLQRKEARTWSSIASKT